MELLTIVPTMKRSEQRRAQQLYIEYKFLLTGTYLINLYVILYFSNSVNNNAFNFLSEWFMHNFNYCNNLHQWES